jgi:serine phosphatase RsbU (regulator of sigma subunit)/ligand-binding sensor domain-containing protein
MKLTSITWLALICFVIVNQSFSYFTNSRVNLSNTFFVPSDTVKTLNKVQGNPYITNYQFSDEEQLIWSISHTKSGEMVFAHRQGITIYNGTSFTNIKLNSVPVTLQTFHESNMILVGCENEYGLLKKENTGEFQYQRLIDPNYNSGEIQEIKVTESHIYFYSNDQVFCHNSHTLKFEKMWKVSNNEAFNGIIQLADQIFINKKNKGLAKITNEENFQIIQGTKGLSNQLILFSIPFNQNSTIIGTHENNLYLFDGKKLTPYSFQNQKYISDNQLVDGIWLNENQFALSTLSGGILLIDKGKAKIETIINYQNGLPDDEIFAIERDLQGGIWISHGFGISRLNYRLPVEDFSQFPGIEGNLLDVTEFEKTIYIATTQGVFYLDTVRNTLEIKQFIDKQQNRESETTDKEIIKLSEKEEDSEQNEPIVESEKKRGIFHWLKRENREKKKKERDIKAEIPKNESTQNDQENHPDSNADKNPSREGLTVAKSDRKQISFERKKTKILSVNYVFKKVNNISGKCKQLVKSGSSLLVATNKGLFSIEDGKTKLVLKNLYINTVVPSKNKDILYIGYDKGLTAIKAEKNTWKELSKIKPKDFNQAVFDIAEDEKQNLWVGTENAVYYFLTDKNFQTKSTKIYNIGSDSKNITSIRFFENQTLFIYSKQFYRFSVKTNKIEPVHAKFTELSNYQKLIESQPEISWFQTELGWKYLSHNLELSQAQISLLQLFTNIQNIKTDDLKNIWVIDGNNRIFKIRPQTESNSYLKDFNVYLEKITGDNGALIPVDNITIPSEIKSLSFKIGASYYLRSEKVEYQYFIVDRMKNWSEWKTSPNFEFLVYPGTFKLKLRARNIFGDIQESPDYLITVQSPVWQKAWFIATASGALILLLALLVIGILKKRERKLQRDNKILENKVVERTREIVKQKEEIELKNKEITDSLNYASQIQAAILPPPEIIKNLVYDFFIINQPKDIVSGDFYWAANVHNKLIITAADCTGHGVPGAFLSLLGVTFLNEIANKIEVLQANLVLDCLRSRVISSLHQHGHDKKRLDGIDLSLAIIDFKSMQLQFAGANNPLYIIRDGFLTEFKGNRMPIGFQSSKIEPFTNHIIEIRKNDQLYMFSDGFTDQFGGALGRKFLSRNFKTLLTEICSLSMQDQEKTLIETFKMWKGRFEQIDDVLIIGIKI